MLALLAPSQCAKPRQLSVDLHLLRKSEAISVLEAILQAAQPPRAEGLAPMVPVAATAADPAADPARAPSRNHCPAAAAPWAADAGGGGGAPALPAAASGLATRVVSAPRGDSPREAFSSLEVVVGRGAHSRHGVARLRPAVTRYLVGKGFPVETAGGEKREGVVVVSLRESAGSPP